MSNALRDQLLKAGLVNEKQVKKAVKDKRKEEQRIQGQGRAEELEQAKLEQQRAQAEKVERDRLLNQQLREQAEQKALWAQVRQLVEQNRQPMGESETPYNFQDRGKVKRLYLGEEARRRVMNGVWGIARLDGKYVLIPHEAAEKLRQRDPATLVLLNDPPLKSTPDAEDPYARYEIPDDLMW